MQNIHGIGGLGKVEGEPLQRHVLSAIIGPTGGRKLAHEAATLFENELLTRGLPSGEFVCALSDFRQRFQLGHRAAEEAIAILKNRGLIEARRGPSGGLYVSEPTAEAVAERLVIHLSLSGTSFTRVLQARQVAQQMIIATLLRMRRLLPRTYTHIDSQRDFFEWLAQQTGDASMQFIVALIEAIYCRCVEAITSKEADIPTPVSGHPQPLYQALVEAINVADSAKAQALGTEVTQSAGLASSVVTASLGITAVSAALGLSNHVSGGLAARLMWEIHAQHLDGKLCQLASEEQIGERFGASAEIVRQALRMLEDLGLIDCHRGRRGVLLRSRPQDGAIIRLICASFIARGVRATDFKNPVGFLSTSMYALAAQRVRDGVLSAAALRSAYAERPSLAIAEQKHFETFLIELADNPILSALIRAFSLCYLFSDRCERRGHYPSHLRAAITDCNLRILDAIAHGDVEAAKLGALQKDELMATHLSG